MSDFINPYNFVMPVREVTKEAFIKRDNAINPDGSSLLNGTMELEMEALTPLMTADSNIEYWSATHKKIKDRNSRDSYKDIKIESDPNIKDGDEILYTENKTTDTIRIYPKDNINNDIASALTGTPQQMLDKINNWRPNQYTGIFFYDDKNRPRVKSNKKTELVSHAVKKFFNFDGKYIIPPDSIKGTVRSVLEAFSNSCFSIFYSKKDNQLSYRQIPGNAPNGSLDTRYERIGGKLRLKPAMVINQLQNGNLELQIFKLSDRIRISRLKEIAKKENLSNYKDLHGRKYTIDNKEGYIKITGEHNAKKKNYERIFCNPAGKAIANKQVVQKYNDMIEEQRKICKPEDYDKHTFHGGKLTVGSLVYVKENNGNIDFITHVNIPRIWFEKGPREALGNISPELLPCSGINNLCPACDLFGTILPDQKKGIAGKVHFSPAFLTSEPQNGFITLSALSSPKPTSVNFYLRNPQNDEKVVSYDSVINNAGPYLRGRKFYFHHQPDMQNFSEEEQTNQNSTSEYLKEGAKFKFSVDFHGLKKEELGLLLLSIQGHKKIGMAKPLGFGSVKINCLSLNIFDIQKRFSSLIETCEIDKDLDLNGKVLKYINIYIKSYLDFINITYNDNDFGRQFMQLPNIQELLIMLNTSFLNNNEIKYPRKDAFGFKWFADNKAQALKTPLSIKNNGQRQNDWS